MKHKEITVLLLMGFCCGSLLAFTYINPYNGQITLSELILQLSGSRGEFSLGFSSLPELLSFSSKLLPTFLFELYVGTSLYQHFCTASVYIFSRTPNRIAWYAKECIIIARFTLMYQVFLVAISVIVTCFRYNVIWTATGWGLLIIHIGIYSLWSFSMTLLVNILAILLGSGNAFMIIIVAQLICITCIRLLNSLESNGTLFFTVLNINPIAHLVIGWQYSSLRGLNEAIHAPWNVMSLSGTIFYLIAIAVLILVIGGHYVHKCDLIISDLEFGGM